MRPPPARPIDWPRRLRCKNPMWAWPSRSSSWPVHRLVENFPRSGAAMKSRAKRARPTPQECLWLPPPHAGAVAIFVYVGGEVAIGSFLVNYLKEPAIAVCPRKWRDLSALLLGRRYGGPLPGHAASCAISDRPRAGSVCVYRLHLGADHNDHLGSVRCGPCWRLGLFNSIMFPTIFTLAIARLGNTQSGSGILCMAIVGARWFR